ncbi:hypothetical protein [uncultured Desulfuromonas sp.]|uniref:hypothetical protein n=1 Tax=uncultured Desulfuromonas sp. TaxID=181013 RepID=UPI002AAA79CE|nr:hypothetical protein [uncultured Desulfuromonas sp.]
MTIDYSAWQFWLNLIIAIGVVLNTAYTWWSNRSKVTAKTFAEHAAQLENIRNRMTKVEANSGCSQHSDFDVRLRKVEIVVGKTDGRLEGIGNALDNIQNFLMTGNGNR